MDGIFFGVLPSNTFKNTLDLYLEFLKFKFRANLVITVTKLLSW